VRQVVLYIKDKNNVYQQAEMFNDETISITSKIQDVKEPEKIFTDFTQAFTIPASKENNKILQHWYNSNVQDGFDYRIKKDAILEVDYTPFRRGKVQIKKVILKNGAPFSYNIIFYGNTVNLKDAMKDDELQQLDYLDNYNHDYNAGKVYDGFQSGLDENSKTNSIIYPLITHTKRLYYDSAAAIRSYAVDGSVNSSKLIISGGAPTAQKFTSSPVVEQGDYVVNTTKDIAAIVTMVESATQLALSEDIFEYNDSYKIYKKIQYDGNLYYDNTQSKRGLSYVDIKPAILCSEIIVAIEQKYNIDFIGDFLTSDAFSNLYLWLHRNKGGLSSEGEQSKIIGDLQRFSGSTSFDVTDTNWTFDVAGDGREQYDFSLALNVKTGYTDVKYTVKAYDSVSGVVVAELKDVKDDQTLSWGVEIEEAVEITDFNINWTVTAESTLFLTPTLTLYYKEFNDGPSQPATTNLSAIYVTNPTEINTLSQVIVKDHMPKIKCIDFISGIFKMFNLTAYYDDDYASSTFGKIKVQTLDDFYQDASQNISGGSYNISKYVDVTQSVIEAPITYKTLDFKYKEPKTLLSKQHKEEFNDIFGDESFTLSSVDSGKTHKVELPFEHMKYERLFDDETGDVTEILWGYAADGKFDSEIEDYPAVGNYDPVLTAPLLFYGIRELMSGTQYINWIDVDDVPNNPPNNITRYWRPSNTNSSGESEILYNYNNAYSGNVNIYPEYTLNFDNEVDEWTLTDYNGNTNSLFRNFYGNYIRDLFDKRKRILKIDAHLSQEILINHQLNDKLIINDEQYIINQIRTNFMTEKSKLELLNVLPPTYHEIQLYYDFTGNTCNSGTLVTVYSDVASVTFGSETVGKIYANKSLTVFAPSGKYGNGTNYDTWTADGYTPTTPSLRAQGFWESEYDELTFYPLSCSGGG
jgi:hypothetical protein